MNGADLLRYTQELARQDTAKPVIGAPAELLYVVYELGLNSNGERCRPYHSTFNLIRLAERFRLDCQEAVASGDEVREFLGTWMTPSPVTIKPNSLFVVIEGGIPAVARIEDAQIEVIARKLTGRLSGDGKSLAWANGATWERRSGDPSAFEGTWWFHDTCIVRKARVSDVLIINSTDAGMIQPGWTILAPERGAAGALSTDHKKIFWTDSSTWARPQSH